MKNLVSVQSLPVQEACAFTRIRTSYTLYNRARSRPMWIEEEETSFQHWQPSAIAWMLKQADTPIHGAILADAVPGFGTLMLAILLVTSRQLSLYPGPAG